MHISNSKFTLLDLKYMINALNNVIDKVIVVKPVWKKQYDLSGVALKECKDSCSNTCPLCDDELGCICGEAISTQETKSRFTFTRDKAYFVISKPIKVSNDFYCIVMIQELDKDFAFGSHKDTEAAKAISDISSSVNIDNLTQIFNRKYYNDNINYLVQEAIDKSTPLSLAQIDIDNFKQFNDKYGHECGDIVLKTVAMNMQKILSEHTKSFNVRMGGDEFLVIGVGISKSKFKYLMQQLCYNINSTKIKYNGQVVNIGCSIGVAEVLEDKIDTSVELYNKADKQLYRAKEKGKNTVC